MSKLFEDAGIRGKRKWQCFVCGKQYKNFETYKEHIIDKHEEGREFIICPTCGAPVRDVRAHFRAKHPKRTIPKNCQMKVTVWQDFSPSGVKRKSKKPNFREGFFISNKMNGAELHYRSGYECDVYECLEVDLDVHAYYVEPFKIPYYYKGKWHKYIPDLRVNYIDETVDIWEIKPANQTQYEKNKAKWAAMNEYATKHGWRFTVITEVGIGKLKSKIKKQVK